ncbi:MAG: phage major capsid protein [Oscillospiraceae bacterium]|nr:phage major capsid protein [Oscillospiraceae bacterium]
MATYENIKLDKGLYTTGKSFTQALESIDPSENYKGTSLEGLDAYQRQLKRFDIHVNGRNSDTVEKFFKTADSAALFPEYVNRAVKQGIMGADKLESVVATTTVIDGLDYRPITSVSDGDKEASVVAESAIIPSTTIKTQPNLIKLNKRGRMLIASYEAIRFHRLDLFTVTLRQIGAYIARSQLKDAVDVLINGDGNSNAAAVISTSSADSLAYSDIVNLWSKLDPYEMTTLIAGPAMMSKLLNMSEFKDAEAGLTFHATGKSITPLGAELIRCDAVPGDQIIALDKNCALERVQAGEIVTDFDKLIDRQLERASVTSITGFAKIHSDAALVLAE